MWLARSLCADGDMFSLLQNITHSCKSETLGDINVLVIGLDNAGKSSVLAALSRGWFEFRTRFLDGD